MARTIAENPSRFNDTIALFELSEERLQAGLKRAEARERVIQFYESEAVGLEKLASNITAKAAELGDDIELKLEVTAVLLKRKKGDE